MKDWAIAIMLRKDMPTQTVFKQVLSLRSFDTNDEAESSAVQWAMENNPGWIITLITSLEIKQEQSK